MNIDKLPIPRSWRERLRTYYRELVDGLNSPWLKLSVLAVAAWVALQQDISFGVSIGGIDELSIGSTSVGNGETQTAQPRNVSQLTSARSTATPAERPATKRKKLTSEEQLKRERQLAYVRQYVDVAQAEMNRYGIPASITLAQGILESGVGASKLATRNKNHFGIKCFSRTCGKGHCSNFTDDTHKDFFRIYGSAQESFRSHSLLLKNNKRYQRLFSLRPSDYRGWAHGLKKAGYATDKRYAEKIIRYIEDLELHRYDG